MAQFKFCDVEVGFSMLVKTKTSCKFFYYFRNSVKEFWLDIFQSFNIFVEQSSTSYGPVVPS